MHLIGKSGYILRTPSKNGSCVILAPLVRNFAVDLYILYSADHTLLLVCTVYI